MQRVILLLRLAVALLNCQAHSLFCSFAKIQSQLGAKQNITQEQQVPLVEIEHWVIRYIPYYLKRILNYIPVKLSCFVQCLAVAQTLQSYQVPYVIYFGVKQDNKKGFHAHAWLTSGKHHLTGHKQFNITFKPITCYSRSAL